MLEKLKSFLNNETVYIALLLLFVAITSFGLGRQSVSSPTTNESLMTDSTVVIEAQPSESVVLRADFTTPDDTQTTTATTQPVVASRGGTRYHHPTCPGAKQISEENRLTFHSIAEARAAGYTPAQNCPELSL